MKIESNTSNNLENIAERLSFALIEWSKIIGNEFVITSGIIYQKAQKDCRANSHYSLAVVKPGNIDELIKCVAIASTFRIPIYPISRGCNWGYGSATPASSDNVVFDLSRMNRIIEINRDLAYAIVEPGVTQRELYEAIESTCPDRFADATGSSPHASIIGNLLERGYGLTPYADHFAHAAGMEVLLADGNLCSTGFGRFSNCKSTYLYKWGLGPHLEGLFTQSNYGIVTKVGIWLMPKPEYFGAISFVFDSDNSLCLAAPILRELRLRGLMRGAVHIANDMRLISSLQQYPYKECNGITPLPDNIRTNLRSRWKVSAWNALGGIWGTRKTVKAELYEIRKALKGYAKVQFVPSSIVEKFARFPWLYRIIFGHELAGKKAIFDLLNGKPSEGPLMGPFWRLKTPAPKVGRDPTLASAGVIWCGPVVPLTSKDLSCFLEASQRIVSSFSFELNVGVTILSERAVCCTVGILFDLQDPEQSSKAEECRSILLQEMLRNGYVPYRAGSDVDATGSVLFNQDSNFQIICNKIKESIDPFKIISPGRYGIG